MSERDEPCRVGVVAGQVVTRPCPNCGHVQLLHPGPHNPALRACLICEVRDALTALTGGTPT
jgi:hypothetical protein